MDKIQNIALSALKKLPLDLNRKGNNMWLSNGMYLVRCLICLWAVPAIFGAELASGPFVAKPYLQLGRMPADPTYMDVVWHSADAEAVWTVETRSPGGAWSKGVNPTYRRIGVPTIEPHRVYRAEVKHLAPGKTFEYRVLRDGQPLFSSTGTARKAAGQPYRLGIFGDIAADKDPQKKVAYQLSKAKPDAVMVMGDIVYSRGRITEYRHHFFDCYNGEVASPETGAPLTRSILFIGAPGNHDTATTDLEKFPDAQAYFYYWSQPLNGPTIAPAGANAAKITGPPANIQALKDSAGEQFPRMANFSFDYGNAHWTILDSNPFVDWSDVELREWLKNDLASAKDATWRFIGFHHPGFNSAIKHQEEKQMRKVADLFEEYKVDVVFSGHVHNYQRSFPVKWETKTSMWTLDKKFDGASQTRPNGVIYIVTGAGGAGVYNPEQQDYPDTWSKFTDKFVSKVNSFSQVDVDGRRFEFRQISDTGTVVDHFVITK